MPSWWSISRSRDCARCRPRTGATTQVARSATNLAQDARPWKGQRAGCTRELGRVAVALLVIMLGLWARPVAAQRRAFDCGLAAASTGLILVRLVPNAPDHP